MPYQATPQLLTIYKGKPTASFMSAMGQSDVVAVQGSVVTSPDAPGSVVYTTACWGSRNHAPCQRVLMTAHSPKGLPINKTLEFHSYDAGGENAQLKTLPSLALSIIDGLLHESVDSAAHLQGATLVPLLMGPGSVALEQPVVGPSDEELVGILGTVLGLATTVIPAVAPVALDVAKQLFGKDKMSDEELGGLFDTIAQIGRVAVPIAGTVLTSIGEALNK